MAEQSQLKQKVSKGILWGSLNQGLYQLLNLFIGIFLARILTPADYGMVGVLTIFSAIAGALQEGGFISALANRKNVTQTDLSTVFWVSFSCSTLFYIILFFLAPLIARFYELPELTNLARFIFIGFWFAGLAMVPRAILFRDLKVKQSSIITLLSLAISGCVGITLAMLGFAYWGLAAQTVTYTGSVMIISYIITKWHPSLEFSFPPIKEMLGYSSKLIITNIFSILNNNIFAVLLGKFYSAADVGDFNQANKWNGMGYSVITGIMNGVAQPALAKVNDDKSRQIQVFRKMLRFTSFISFPAMLILALVARDFIVIAIGEKWIFSALILQVLCLWGAFFPVSNLFSNLLLSQGRSLAYMWATIILAIIQIVAVYFSYPYGLYRMLYVFITINILWLIVWYLCARKYLRLSAIKILGDIMPFLFISVIAVTAGYFICLQIQNIYLAFICKALIATAIYISILWILKAKILRESLSYLLKKDI